MWDDCVLKIEKLENGYEVSVIDEKVQTENEKPKSSWQNPWKSYAFEDAAGVVKFVESVLGSIKKPPSASDVYSKAFSDATEDSGE